MTKYKAWAWVLRILAWAVTVGMPLTIVAYKFPLWKAQGGGSGAMGAGTIILIIIVLVTFRKYIVAWAKEKLGALSAGVSLVLLWSTLAVVCMVLASITTILEDLATVFLFSAIGAAIGVALLHGARKISQMEEKPREEAEKGEVTDGTSERPV